MMREIFDVSALPTFAARGTKAGTAAYRKVFAADSDAPPVHRTQTKYIVRRIESFDVAIL